MKTSFLFVLLATAGVLAFSHARADGLTIEHNPVSFAMRGQPLTLKAKVVGEVQEVTLFYALFRDAAPFSVPMKATGLGYYVGTIDAAVVAGVDNFSYYIEAQDKAGVMVETPWHKVGLRVPDARTTIAPSLPDAVPAAPIPPVKVPETPAPEDESTWSKPLVIGGAALLIAGGAYALSQGGGGGDDDGGGDTGGGDTGSTNIPSGRYSGSATTCFTLPSESSSCSTYSMEIVIDANGVVYSDSLRPGEQMTSELNGSSFTLVATVSDGGTNGLIRYRGVVSDGQVSGSVSGTATTPEGTEGDYSGSFSASE